MKSTDVGTILKATDEYVGVFGKKQQQNCVDGINRPVTCDPSATQASQCICTTQESFAPLTRDPSLQLFNIFPIVKFTKDDRLSWLVTASNAIGEAKPQPRWR
jgi:hypothetical protein